MKANIKYIAIIDRDNNINHIQFEEGVNIITGKSSTGKSAVLEVFDYCFGSSEFNIPDGVITEKAKLYFIVINLYNSFLILGRGEKKNEHYITTETNSDFVNDYKNFSCEYFEKLDRIGSADFNKELNKYFNIDIEDTDEDLEDRKLRYNNAKKQAPSFRHFTSFMLQHQNLIANKHALFYRFDEKEKKDQTIEQFKIFLSFVDAKYYPLKQKLAELKREKKQKELIKEKYVKFQESLKESLEDILIEYEIKTNKKLFEAKIEEVINMPKKYLQYLDNFQITTNEVPDENISKRNEFQKQYNLQSAEIRKIQNLISNIDVSIIYAKDFANQKSNVSIVNDASTQHKNCVFCGQENSNIIVEQNKLTEALTWFNSEMNKSTYTIQSFESDKKNYELKIKSLREEAKKTKQEIYFYDKVIHELNKNRSVEEQAFKIILKVETFLETIEENNIEKIQNEIDEINERIEEIEYTLNQDYNIEKVLKRAARQINQQINILGKTLDFEKIYKDSLNLKFDIETFELYQQKTSKGKDTQKVYLRSMGSGANWLYSHISLFTGLLYYFCSLKEKCLIPTILFIDQPSQVYFPNEIDKDEKYDARKLKESSLKKGEDLDFVLDEDLGSVTNLYNQLNKFCVTTQKETGIMPQIIITDHADNLKLDDIEFETLVKARWRKEGEGFIKMNV